VHISVESLHLPQHTNHLTVSLHPVHTQNSLIHYLSGLNFVGSGQISGSICKAKIGMITIIPFGMKTPFIVTSSPATRFVLPSNITQMLLQIPNYKLISQGKIKQCSVISSCVISISVRRGRPRHCRRWRRWWSWTPTQKKNHLVPKMMFGCILSFDAVFNMQKTQSVEALRSLATWILWRNEAYKNSAKINGQTKGGRRSHHRPPPLNTPLVISNVKQPNNKSSL